MDGQYGDSTRSVKAAGSRRRSRDSRWRLRRCLPRRTICRRTSPLPLDTYGRGSNPTWRQLESALADLEGATSALTFGSGMAAITAVLRVLAKPGTKLVVPADGYYQVRRYASESLAPLGVDGRIGHGRRDVRRRCGCRRGAGRDPGQSDLGRGRPASARADLPGSRGHPRRRQHHADTAWAATTLARRRPRRGECHEGLGRPRRPASPDTWRAAIPT